MLYNIDSAKRCVSKALYITYVKTDKPVVICDDTDTPCSHVIYNAVSRTERQLCFNHVTALSADQQLIYYEELPMT